MENETCDLVNTKPHRSAKHGEIITFGTYPKRADVTDKTPIKWWVLRNSGDELFNLSEYILTAQMTRQVFRLISQNREKEWIY